MNIYAWIQWCKDDNTGDFSVVDTEQVFIEKSFAEAIRHTMVCNKDFFFDEENPANNAWNMDFNGNVAHCVNDTIRHSVYGILLDNIKTPLIIDGVAITNLVNKGEVTQQDDTNANDGKETEDE